MAVPAQIGRNSMEQYDEQPQIDRAYTVSRITWMLENYHALLSKKPKRPEDEDVRPGATSKHSQWWTSQAYWRRVDRKADLDVGINRLHPIDHRMAKIMNRRYRGEPGDQPEWSVIAREVGLSERQVFRLHNRAIYEIALFLRGVSDE